MSNPMMKKLVELFTSLNTSLSVDDLCCTMSELHLCDRDHCDNCPFQNLEKMKALKQQYPEAIIIAHPESQENLLSMADYVGSTSGMIKYVREHPNNIFIVATEAGILYEMKKEVPSATLIPAPAYENNSCACSECEYMKLNTMQKVYDCLQGETPEVHVDLEVAKKALVPINRMMEMS